MSFCEKKILQDWSLLNSITTPEPGKHLVFIFMLFKGFDESNTPFQYLETILCSIANPLQKIEVRDIKKGINRIANITPIFAEKWREEGRMECMFLDTQ